VILLKPIGALCVGLAGHFGAEVVSSLRSCSISDLASRCWKVQPMAVLARPMAMVRRVLASSSGCPCMTLSEL
jgi:hypothetical protein